jgi:prolyl-tRNA synthetase
MAMPVIQGEKSEGERFPGADHTYSIEAMMQDRKALQSGTSHFLGQNFAKAQDIMYLDDKGERVHAWTTSWGVSTRLIGGMIMTHADDDGLIVPPKLAPAHVVIMPITFKSDNPAAITEYCHKLRQELRDIRFNGERIRVEMDERDIRGGEKVWSWVKKGVPIRIEVGQRDMDADSVFMARRDKSPKEKGGVPRAEFVANIVDTLEEIQTNLYERAKAYRDENTKTIDSKTDFIDFFTPQNKEQPEIHGGFAMSHWCGDESIADQVQKEHAVSIRNIPIDGDTEPGECIFTGKPSKQRVVWAKSY